MIDKKMFFDLVFSIPNATDVPHFERTGFKLPGHRMFATYLEKDNTANIFLSPKEQMAFCRLDEINIYPVPNKWGEKGATTFVLTRLASEVVMDALLSACRATRKL